MARSRVNMQQPRGTDYNRHHNNGGGKFNSPNFDSLEKEAISGRRLLENRNKSRHQSHTSKYLAGPGAFIAIVSIVAITVFKLAKFVEDVFNNSYLRTNSNNYNQVA